MALVKKQPSRVVQTRYAKESLDIGVLDQEKSIPSPSVWRGIGPNSFSDFGRTNTLTPRTPFDESRQRDPGRVTDVDAAGGFNIDVTPNNVEALIEGFLFADARRKGTQAILSATARNLDDTYEVDDAAQYFINSLVFAENMAIAGNNGLKRVTAVNINGARSGVVAAGGAGYAVGDKLTLVGGTFGTEAVFNVDAETAGVIDTVSLDTPGNYSVVPTSPVSTSTGGGGTLATLTVVFGDSISVAEVLATEVMTALQATVDVGGTGYTLNDPLTLTGGDAVTQAIFNVDTEVTGIVETVSVLTPGDYTVPPANPVVTTGGTGAGATLNVIFGPAGTAGALLTVVGHQFDAGDLDVDASGNLPVYASSVQDLSVLGADPGEFIYMGGDGAAFRFANSNIDGKEVNNGWKRLRAVAANAWTVDKSDFVMTTEVTTTETIQVFFSTVIRNEADPALIVRSTYNFERTLGAPDNAFPADIQAEYIEGAVPGELVTNVPLSGKMNMDMTFTSTTGSVRTAAEGLKSDDPSAINIARLVEEFYTTTGDFKRKKIALVVPGEEAPLSLLSFLSELSFNLNNNLSPDKAIGVEGAFDVTDGTLSVSGQLTAYFNNVAAIQAIAANDTATIDCAIVNNQQGMVIDLPLIKLGEGRVNAEVDQSITIPVSMDAARGRSIDPNLDYTVQYQFFKYLPLVAGFAA